MGAWQIFLELGLIVLLGAMLFHALRLERALGVVRRDRAELEAMLRGFNESTHQAEVATERLRGAADGAGRHVARQIELAAALKEDLAALIDRGERLANRLDSAARPRNEPETQARRTGFSEPAMQARHFGLAEPEAVGASGARVRSQAERDLLRALRVTR